MKINNYENLRSLWRQRICSIDLSSLSRKCPFLNLTDDELSLTYLSDQYTVSRDSGAVYRAGQKDTIPLYDELNILTLLWYAKEGAALSGQWVSFAQLKGASPFAPAFTSGNLQPFAATFHGHRAELEQALLALGGEKLSAADVGYIVPVFPCIPVTVLFWEGDDEFPSQVNLLFDRNATDFIHVESIVTIASQLLRHLADLANVPICSQAF